MTSCLSARRLVCCVIYCFTVNLQAEHVNHTVHTRAHAHKRSGLSGFDPGDPAPRFSVKTLNGEFVYPPTETSDHSVIIHAFTNKSAFLECLWTSKSSVSDLIQFLPLSAEVLFLSLDDSAAQDVMWMREQVYRVAVESGH
ncbi:uncharacterized protein si:dkey-256h2.1 isoform X1, partial [Tachysurus ichikawai]